MYNKSKQIQIIMINNKKDVLHFIQTYPGLKNIQLDYNPHFENELLEDPEIGGEFFSRNFRQFVNYLSIKKYEKEYFLSIYHKMSEQNKMTSIIDIYGWTYEVINAEQNGNHYFNDPYFILQLFTINPEIIYLIHSDDFDVLNSETFLFEAKDALVELLNKPVLVYPVEVMLLDSLKKIQREENLTQQFREISSHKVPNNTAIKRKL